MTPKLEPVMIEVESCMQCPHHDIENDPDPHDSFCSDDVAVTCKLMKPSADDSKVWWSGKPFFFKPCTTSCRPYNTVKETSPPPSWCPLRPSA